MITKVLSDRCVWRNKKIRLNLSFDAVLRVFALQKDALFEDDQKIDLSLQMLIKNHSKIRSMHITDKSELLKYIIDTFIVSKKRNTGSNAKTFDFAQDGEYIYSSFLMAYKIDLIDEQGKLDWRKFIALFQGLPDKTKIREVMSIRARKIPSPTKYNADEIKSLQEAKAFYALEMSPEETEKQFQEGLAGLAGALVKLAGEKDG